MWGQSAHSFADSNDADRDRAFYGIWQDTSSPVGFLNAPASTGSPRPSPEPNKVLLLLAQSLNLLGGLRAAE